MITVEKLRDALNSLDDSLDNKIIHINHGFEGTYLILEDKLDRREGREVIQIT